MHRATVPAGDAHSHCHAVTSAGKSSILGPGAVFAVLVPNGHKMIREGEKLSRRKILKKPPGFHAKQDWALNFNWQLAAAAAREGTSYEPLAGEADDEPTDPVDAFDPAVLAAAAVAASWPKPVAKGTVLYCRMYRALKEACSANCRLCKTAIGQGGEHAGGWWAVAVDREQLEVAKNVWSYVVTITNGAAVKLGGGDLEPIGGLGSPKPQCFPTLEAALGFAKSEVRRKLGEGSRGKRRANSRYKIDESVSYGYSDAVSGA